MVQFNDIYNERKLCFHKSLNLRPQNRRCAWLRHFCPLFPASGSRRAPPKDEWKIWRHRGRGLMSFVYLLFDPEQLNCISENDLKDPMQLFDRLVLGIFANKLYANNEQEKLSSQLDRPVYVLRYRVCDPSLIICKRMSDMIPDDYADISEPAGGSQWQKSV